MITEQKKSLGSEMARGTKLTPTSTLDSQTAEEHLGLPKGTEWGFTPTLLSSQGPKYPQIAYG